MTGLCHHFVVLEYLFCLFYNHFNPLGFNLSGIFNPRDFGVSSVERFDSLPPGVIQRLLRLGLKSINP